MALISARAAARLRPLSNGRPQVLPVFDGHDEMPTYVAFTSNGERLVGWAAKRQAVMNPANTIFTVKRLIGRKFASEATQAELGLLPYKVIPSAAGGLWVEAGGRSYTPTEITAIMLAEVRRQRRHISTSRLQRQFLPCLLISIWAKYKQQLTPLR